MRGIGSEFGSRGLDSLPIFMKHFELDDRVIMRFRKLRRPGRIVKILEPWTNIGPVIRELAFELEVNYNPARDKHKNTSRTIRSYIVLGENGMLYWPNLADIERSEP